MSTSARALSTGVCGSTPWPKLKMCPGRPAACCRTSLRTATQFGHIGQERHRIEIALDRALGPIIRHASSSRTRQSTPITVAPLSANNGNQLRIAGGETDDRHSGRDSSHNLLHERQHVLAIIVRTERAGPTVEELHCLRPAAI